MNYKKILKIVGLLIVPPLIMAIVIFFLFPYINEQKHEQVASDLEQGPALADSTSAMDMQLASTDPDSLKKLAKGLRDSMQTLQMMVDSVETQNDSLKLRLMASRQQIDSLSNNSSSDSLAISVDEDNGETSADGEKFTENAQSLLGLEGESLAPILSEMSDRQLKRLFKAGNSLQRKKLLRTLDSERAAKLMDEVL